MNGDKAKDGAALEKNPRRIRTQPRGRTFRDFAQNSIGGEATTNRYAHFVHGFKLIATLHQWANQFAANNSKTDCQRPNRANRSRKTGNTKRRIEKTNRLPHHKKPN